MRNTPRSEPEPQTEIAPRRGIGVLKERSLHNAIKAWYARPGDQIEVKVDGFIIDIRRADLLIEIQTRHFTALKRKLRTLLPAHRVRLVYPLAIEKWITRTTASSGRILGKRKSSRRGDLLDLFDELVAIPDLMAHPNFELQVLLTHEEEIRRDDGKGSWWRRGYSIADRKLVQIVDSVSFRDPADFLRFLPAGLPEPFSNKLLAHALDARVHDVRKLTYCLRKMGVLVPVGKLRNEVLFQVCDEGQAHVSDSQTGP